jgi:hypothetical protein
MPTAEAAITRYAVLTGDKSETIAAAAQTVKEENTTKNINSSLHYSNEWGFLQRKPALYINYNSVS